jgi:PAS domain S-box-containing protein
LNIGVCAGGLKKRQRKRARSAGNARIGGSDYTRFRLFRESGKKSEVFRAMTSPPRPVCRKSTAPRALPATVGLQYAMRLSGDGMAYRGTWRSGIGAYGAGAACALAALALQWAIRPLVGSGVPFLVIIPVLAVVAAVLGRGPSMVVLAAGAASGVLWFEPVGEWHIDAISDRIALAGYGIVGLLMALLAGRIRVITRHAAEVEQRLNLAQVETGIGMFEVDFPSKTVMASRSMVQLLGHVPRGERMRLDEWAALQPPDELAKGASVLRQKLREGAEGYEREHRIELPDGGVRWLMSRVHIESGRDGRALRLRGASVDITERKQMEALLRSTRDDLTQQVADLLRLHELSSQLLELPSLQAQLEAILRAVCEFHGTRQGLVSLCDRDRQHLVAEASLGFSAAALERLGAVRLGQGACGSAVAERRRVIVQDTEQDACFADFRELAASEGFRAVHSTPLVSQGGEVLGAVSVHFANPRVPSEREMRLADICARKAAVFVERARAQAALHDADRRKDEFLAMLAHELRNPLAPIRQAAVISQSPTATEAQKRWSHEVIDRQVQHMALLLDDLLDVSRITRGMLQLRKSPTLLSEVIDAAVETARPLIDARRHKLLLEVPDEPLLLEVDALRMAQVIANLLTNAAKYTDPGGTVRVGAAAQGDDIEIRVADTGIGLRRESLGEIFEMFTQVRSVEDRSAGGLGIGLALARGLVQLHGGAISAHSEGPGRGSCFTVRLPRARAVAAAEALPAPLPHAAMPARKVLVADDNRDAAESLAELLRLGGHEVAVAFDGEAALAEYARFLPDVALLDIGMPKLDGNAVAGEIRRLHGERHTTLVAITGWGQDKDKNEAFAAGFDHHLTKPVDPEKVNRLLYA